MKGVGTERKSASVVQQKRTVGDPWQEFYTGGDHYPDLANRRRSICLRSLGEKLQ